MVDDPQGQSAGPATDRNNEPVVDPTANVRELVDAANLRQDDLRRATDRMHKREGQHIRELMALRAEFAKEIRKAETGRINAIRAVDVQAVQQAAQVAQAQAQTLAAQVAAAAEAMRTQVAATTTAFTTAQSTALAPINDAIADLRKAQYEAQGQKTQVIETRSAAEDLKPFFDQLQRLIVDQASNQGAKAQAVEVRQTGTDNRTSSINIFSAAIAALSLIALVIFAVLR